MAIIVGQIGHGAARAADAVRAERQRPQVLVARFAKPQGISAKTAIRRQGRQSGRDPVDRLEEEVPTADTFIYCK